MMQLSLHPDVQRFIDEQVRAGRFPTPEAVVEAAVTGMREIDAQLDEETIAAIGEGEAQGDRGEGIELEAFRAEMAKRFEGL